MIRALHAITAAYDEGFDLQVQRLLALGRGHLGFDVGYVLQDEDGTSRVRHVSAPPGFPLEVGVALPQDATSALAAHDVGHPVLVDADTPEGTTVSTPFGCGVHIGVSLVLGGSVWGTLGFWASSPERRRVPAAHLDAIQLMAAWLGGELQRRANEDKLREAAERLRQLTRIDPLTQLLNRRGLEEILPRIAGRVRYGGSIHALLVDIDDFKAVNDTWGHSGGDHVLVAVAETLSGCVRPFDLVARVGGDEFVVLLPDTTLDNAVSVAERIRAAIARARVDMGEGECAPRASLGVAPIRSATATVTDVLAQAQDSLRKSKRSGKNTVSWSALPEAARAAAQ